MGQTLGRASSEQVTVFDSVGFALEDFSALRFMRDSAQRLGIGQPLALIPALADPKDLFGFLRPLPRAKNEGDAAENPRISAREIAIA